jgi:hypothetical protein
MKTDARLSVIMTFGFIFLLELSAMAQIQDIKKNSSDNSGKHSNDNSSNNNSSVAEDIGSEIIGGCISFFFESLVGCLFSGRDETNKQVTPPNDVAINNELNELEKNKIVGDSLPPVNNQIIVENQTYNEYNTFQNTKKDTAEFSLDIKANLAIGFEPSADKTYKYYNFLPELRLNLAWFLVDFRYNILTEFSQDLPDAFITWDMLFLFKIKASDRTKIILGTGMHKENYENMLYNQHFFGLKIGLVENRDYLNIDGRLTMDYKTDAYPFSEVGIGYNRRFLNTKSLDGFILLSGTYQNYYNSTDIWAFKTGLILNWHN